MGQRVTARTGDCIFMEREMQIISWEQDILYNTEQYLQLRELSLLVTGCHI